ncbi:HD domain-containing protein [Micromonospora sp. DT62]|uniref:HD domain-containing protein n=1 Tax=Micromonospora sp. DT62 TaxID=3416521 RepID=UPI003CEE92A9
MELAHQARSVAEGYLREPLPRRWRHVQAVANKAECLAEFVAPDEKTLLVAAAWLHDVGYAPALIESGLHALDGARWLRDNGFDSRLAGLVACHSCAIFEAEERGLASELSMEFIDEESPIRDALWYADMTTGPDGQDMTVPERLAEVRTRYGPDHLVTRFWARAEPTLMVAVRRTEDRLSAVRPHPM